MLRNNGLFIAQTDLGDVSEKVFSTPSVVLTNYDNTVEDKLATLVTNIKESGRGVALSVLVPPRQEQILLDLLTTANCISTIEVTHTDILSGEVMLSVLYKVQNFVDYSIETSTSSGGLLTITLEFNTVPVIPVTQDLENLSQWLEAVGKR